MRLAERHRVTGVDISRSSCGWPASGCRTPSWCTADLASVEFPDASFDGVTCFYALGHLPREQLGEVFRSVRGWLRPGGWFRPASPPATTPTRAASGWAWRCTSAATARPQPRAAAEAGFRIDVDEVVPLHESEGTVTFQWVIATAAAQG